MEFDIEKGLFDSWYIMSTKEIDGGWWFLWNDLTLHKVAIGGKDGTGYYKEKHYAEATLRAYELLQLSREKGGSMRKFESGATRDTDEGKLDFEGFLSPIVLMRYAEYLHEHRVQADGKLRASDNWQGLFGKKHYDVCMKSAFRHFMGWWLKHREPDSDIELEDAICAVMFNAQAYLLKILKEQQGISADDRCGKD